MGQLNPTRQEIIAAYEAADNLAELAAHPMSSATDAEVAYDYRETILAALPPKPRPTMDDIEWDDDKHYLAEAEHPTWGKVIMLFQSPNTGNIFFMYPNGGVQHVVYCRPCNLTPTGKRYTLTEGE